MMDARNFSFEEVFGGELQNRMRESGMVSVTIWKATDMMLPEYIGADMIEGLMSNLVRRHGWKQTIIEPGNTRGGHCASDLYSPSNL